MEEPGIVINMKKAIFDRKEVEIAGGIFGREELKEAVKAMEERGKLKEQVRILREALKDAHEGLDSAARYLDKLDSETVVEAVEKGLEQAHAALEATKETP